jgi:hypothetical protein
MGVLIRVGEAMEVPWALGGLGGRQLDVGCTAFASYGAGWPSKAVTMLHMAKYLLHVLWNTGGSSLCVLAFLSITTKSSMRSTLGSGTRNVGVGIP